MGLEVRSRIRVCYQNHVPTGLIDPVRDPILLTTPYLRTYRIPLGMAYAKLPRTK